MLERERSDAIVQKGCLRTVSVAKRCLTSITRITPIRERSSGANGVPVSVVLRYGRDGFNGWPAFDDLWAAMKDRLVGGRTLARGCAGHRSEEGCQQVARSIPSPGSACSPPSHRALRWVCGSGDVSCGSVRGGR